MPKVSLLIAMIVTLIAGAASAQLVPSLPSLPGGIDRLPDQAAGRLGETVDRVAALPRALAAARLDRVARLVARSGGRVALDDLGAPARAGEVVLTDPSDAVLATLAVRGFRLIERTRIDELGVGYARLAVPDGTRLDRALRDARIVAPEVAADVLHFDSGAIAATAGSAVAQGGSGTATLGMIDGGVGAGLAGVRQQGFAAGAPRASDHGSAVASLMVGGGRVRGAAPGATLLAADVYGTDPAGGSAVAIARALGWLVRERAGVVAISLVGPSSPLVARTVAAAQARGLTIVAAVGNDGPAAPPAYPASYPGVVAVTAVDGRGRALIEAGRASHLDYAAPGADMLALDARGRAVRVRGTSFAVPLVAATIARAGSNWRTTLDGTARDLGRRGTDPVFGRGLVCGDCATRR